MLVSRGLAWFRHGISLFSLNAVPVIRTADAALSGERKRCRALENVDSQTIQAAHAGKIHHFRFITVN